MSHENIPTGTRGLEQTKLPLSQASNLPSHCYTSREFYELEVREIFLKEWLCVGKQEQIERPGDYFTIEILNEPIIVTRDMAGDLHALSAVCRHRAMTLVSGEGNLRAFECPYHGWTYSLKGELLGAPEMNKMDNFDRALHCLPSLRLEVWEGFIFINFDPQCMPLAPALEGLSERLANYDISQARLVKRSDYEAACNWKTFMDGLDNYHQVHLHKDTVTDSLSSEDSWIEAPHQKYEVIIYRSLAKNARRTLTGESPFPVIEGLSPKELEELPYMVIWPSFQMSLSVEGVYYHSILPEGPDRCKVMTGICFPKSTAERPNFEQEAQGHYVRWDIVNYEDIRACESVQRGLHSMFFDSGRYSHLEEIVHRFHNYVIDRVSGTDTSP